MQPLKEDAMEVHNFLDLTGPHADYHKEQLESILETLLRLAYRIRNERPEDAVAIFFIFGLHYPGMLAHAT